ncbi:MAG: rhodanese-like domain-containing protein [Gammaproteobacteria bacterium]|nr:rhodanese-like domain-containing protein [Gammaproteobacteria bacterium]MDH5800308.1 rhodanese-like domain-containing protein [Gammaproteobacteria bacterium]
MNVKQISFLYTITLSGLLAIPGLASANMDVKIAPDIEAVELKAGDQNIRIERIQDTENLLTGGFSKTSRKCPPFCIQPINVAPGVKTVGELELLDFMKKELASGSGVLIDARTPSWHEKGTIPGSVNIPFTSFIPGKISSSELSEILYSLGVRKKHDNMVSSAMAKIKKIVDSDYKPSPWDFDNAKTLLLWCNGMWCGQSPRAIKGLLSMGYPPEKIMYYRGGMQTWMLLGLTVNVPK